MLAARGQRFAFGDSRRRDASAIMSEVLTSPEFVLWLSLIGGVCMVLSVSSWVRGVQLLILVMLFGGIAGARIGNTALPVILRDAAIVLPLYLAFAFSKAGPEAFRELPVDIAAGLCAVLGWLVICTFNSNGESGLRLLIGLKVWTFYIPFLLIGISLASRPKAFFAILRAVTICGFIVCAVGLLQGLLIRLMGYGPAMTLFFGTSAAAVTQGFTAFYVGGGIYRIPSTFSFGSQYVAFLFLFLTVAVLEANTDPKPLFRSIGRIAFYVGMLAGLFSGTKGAFLMFPLFALAFAACGLIRARFLIAAPIAIAVAAWTFTAASLNPVELFSFGAEQAQHYSEGFIVDQVAEATRYGVMGQGIGASTGAARFAVQGVGLRSQLGFESYFAKSAAELGSVGLIIISAFLMLVAVRMAMPVIRNFGRVRNDIIAPLAIYVGFVLITSLKGYPLDIDPANVFFWLSVGLVVRLGRNERSLAATPANRGPQATERTARA